MSAGLIGGLKHELYAGIIPQMEPIGGDIGYPVGGTVAGGTLRITSTAIVAIIPAVPGFFIAKQNHIVLVEMIGHAANQLGKFTVIGNDLVLVAVEPIIPTENVQGKLVAVVNGTPTFSL